MNKKSALKQKCLFALIKRCNTNILRIIKKFAADYLCDDVDYEKITIQQALEYCERNIANPEYEKITDFALAIFWYKARSVYFNRIFEINENEQHKEQEVA
jgi:hypothetical protein